MSRDVQVGPALSVELGPQEFRWRPYGYAERTVTANGKPGPVLVALVHPDMEADLIAQRQGSRWWVRRSWREAVDPKIITKRWQVFGICAGVVVAAAVFLAVNNHIDGVWGVLLTTLGLGFLGGALVQVLGEHWATRRAAELRARPEFGYVALPVRDSGDGYEEMVLQFDQVAQAWTRGRVLDHSMEDAREAVVTALLENAENKTPADKANPEWVHAMKVLDSVRTDIGKQGLG